MKSLQILLAEDSLVNQKLAVALFEEEGHRVTVAANGNEALAATRLQQFDLILMDVQMPEMDGLEATVEIREREKQTGTHVPIIAMTAHTLKATVRFFGPGPAFDHVCRLEEMGSQNRWEEVPALLSALETEAARITAALLDHLQENRG